MSASFLKQWASKPASTGRTGEFITGGAGTIIIKDIQLFKGSEDPQTFKLEGFVKDSHKVIGQDDIEPNKPGTSIVFIKQLTRMKGDDGRAVAAMLAVLGPEAPAEGSDERASAFGELVRAGEDGYTKSGTACPARGVELKFETSKVTTQKGVTFYAPTFTHVPFDESTVIANRNILDGKAETKAA